MDIIAIDKPFLQITYGMPGRVGDSPLVGLGCMADNSLGALSATGHGESIIRMALGSRWGKRRRITTNHVATRHCPIIMPNLRRTFPHATRILFNAARGVSGITIKQAARDGLESMRSRVGGHGGVIAVQQDGSWACDFTTERMAWGLATADEHKARTDEKSEPLDGGGVMQVGIDAPPLD